MKERQSLDARRAVELIQRSELLDLDMPLSRVTEAVSGLEEVAGYVLAWDKYVLVVGVADIAGDVINPSQTP